MIMPSLKSLSIRKKVLLIAMMTSLIGLMIAGTIFVMLNRQTTRQEMIDELNIIAKVLANRSKAALEFSDTKLAGDNLEAVRVHPTVQNACLYDIHGALFASFTRAGANLHCKNQPPREVTSFTARHFIVQVPVNLDDEQIGTLSVTSDVSRLDNSTTRLSITVAITMGIVSIITYLLGMRLQTLVTGPIKLLGDTAQQVAESNDYTTRAPKQNDDELGRLITAFNHMMDKIERENLALSASEKRFRTLTDYSPVGIFQTDPTGELLYVNDRFTEITGVPAEHISLARCDELLRLDDGGSFSDKWLHAVGSLDEFLLAFRAEQGRDQVITVIGQAMPLYDAQANVIGYLGSLTDVTELKTAQLKLEQLAFFDPLTHLANRRLMTDCIEEELRNIERNEGQFALLILDLDQFKRVNDSMGHDAGDLLLTLSAERLQSCVRKSDIVGRFGGDEFLILVRDIAGPETPKHIAENILRVLREPISIGAQQIIVTSSIGITVAPIDGGEVRTLIKNADLAMYRAKAEGRDGYQFFSEDMNKRIQEELEIERELRSAIELDQFVLYFQPQIDMTSRKMVGVEALARWIHPVKGLIPPDRFIPVAEDTGLIVPLGKLLIKQACRAAKLLKESAQFPHLSRVSVNLSPRQFHDTGLLSSIREAVIDVGIDASLLEFEITESVLMHNLNHGIEILKDLKALGVGLAIDDFGIGYSSLNYLKRFPIDTLKIDRSFVMDIPQDKSDMEIAAAVIAMAHKLELKVVAEGVETEEQLKFLQENHCDLCQGYYFGKPMPLNYWFEQSKEKIA